MSQQKNNQTRNNPSGSVVGADILNRTMPESLEAESSVLGSMMLDSACIGDVVLVINSESFYRLEHQIIFDALVKLYERGGGLDLVLLRDELKKQGKLDDAGGVNYLGQIANSVPDSSNAMYYAEIVKDKAIMRNLITASSEILNEAFSEAGEVREKLDDAERKIFDVTSKRLTGHGSDMKDLIRQAIEHAEKPLEGLGTGFYELNDMLCGLHNGDMIIVAGRPSMGKTSFAMNIAEQIAIEDNFPVAIFSLEMGSMQLVQRMLCSRAEIDLQAIRKGNLDEDAYAELVRRGSELSEKPLYIDDTPGLTPLELKAKARRLVSRHGIKCILVDYLQLMNAGGGRSESRQQEITMMSRELKALARELDIPVIVLSQLNRAAENREGHRPRMSDLRESGSIEQDADVIMLLHRPAYYEPDIEESKKNIAEVIIAKQRNGPTGTVELLFFNHLTRFANLSQSYIKEPL